MFLWTSRVLSECNGTLTHNHLGYKWTLNNFAKPAKWLNCVMSTYLYGDLTVCFYHVTYVFQNESTLYSCFNVRKLFAKNRHVIWSLCDSNRTQNYSCLKFKKLLVLNGLVLVQKQLLMTMKIKKAIIQDRKSEC